MTTVVQSVANQPLNNVASWSFTLTATGSGNLLVVKAGVQQFGGAGSPSSVTVTDNGSGNTWATAVFKQGTGTPADRFAIICYCLSVSAGVTSVTVTPNQGDFYGSSGIEEVSGGPWALDQTGSANSAASGTVTVACSSVDIGTTDFVAAAVTVDGGQSNTAISDPPSGYTSSSVNQDDSNFAASETCYRINSSAVTDSVTWTYTASASGSGLPAAIASFKVSGGSGNVTKALTAQTATFSQGTMGAAVSNVLTGQTATFAEGTLSGAISKALSGQTATFAQGSLSPAVAYALTALTATFTEGTLTPTTGGDVTKALTGQTATFALGVLSPAIANALSAQTITSSEGTPSAAISYGLTSQTATFTEGSLTPTWSGSAALTGQTASFAQGSMTPGVAMSLSGQSATFVEGALGPAVDYALTAQIAAFTEGTLTAQTSGDVIKALTGLTAVFTLGQIIASGGDQPLTSDTHDGFAKKRPRFDDSAQTQVIRESRLKPKKAKSAPVIDVEPPTLAYIENPEDEEELLALLQDQEEQLISTIELATHLLRTLH